MADAVSGILGRPFAEQVAAFRLRLGDLRPTSSWTDLAGQDHDRAFMVAGAVKADLLADLAAAVDKAITEGTTLETFRADFREIVTRRGWHGWTGEGTTGGEAWRTRVIYRTNMATTYAAGRHAQLVAGGYAWWVYRHGGSAEPRLDHLSWDGVALPPDHPFWAQHYPPNGWGCSCRVFGARTRSGIRRVGGDPGKALPPGWDRISPKTGAPVGIDKGWNHAPGATVADAINTVAGKFFAWPYEVAKAYMAGLPEVSRDLAAQAYRGLPSTAEAVTAYARAAAETDRAAPMKTLGLLTSDQIADVLRLTGGDATGFDWVLDPSAIRHILKRHGPGAPEASRGQRPVDYADFARLLALLADPDSIDRADGQAPLPRLELRKRFPGGTMTALFELRRKTRRLSLVTMWVARPPA